jgi:hypothetical protein
MSEAPIKRATQAQEAAIAAWLNEHRPHSPVPRKVTVPLLGMVFTLHEAGLPWPTRQRLADVIGTTKDAIDRARTVSLSYGEIEEQWSYPVVQRNGQPAANRAKYVIPSKQLSFVCRRADAR